MRKMSISPPWESQIQIWKLENVIVSGLAICNICRLYMMILILKRFYVKDFTLIQFTDNVQVSGN